MASKKISASTKAKRRPILRCCGGQFNRGAGGVRRPGVTTTTSIVALRPAASAAPTTWRPSGTL